MNKIKTLIVAFVVMFMCSVPCYAATKDMSVELTSGYAQANFYFVFEAEQTYNISITDPNESVKTFTITGTTGTVALSEITSGTYTIKISAEDDVIFATSPRVEMIKGEVSSSRGNISVSANVSNLKIWFDNGVLKAKWDDTNVGKVNIQITNPETMEIIANSTVEGTTYSCNLATNVNNVNFYIVPSNSSKVSGSGTSYSVDVVRTIPGTVTFAQKDLYNSNIYVLSVDVIDNTTVRINENNNTVFEQNYPSGGTYEIEVPLNDLENKIAVDIIDAKGNINTYSTSVKKDITAPKFSVNSFDTITKKDTVLIKGRVTEVKKININGFETDVNENGQFEYTYQLEMGDNKIVISAEDSAGNVASNDYIVTRIKVSYVPLYIIGGLVIAFVAVFFICRKVLSNKKKVNLNDEVDNLSINSGTSQVKKANKKDRKPIYTLLNDFFKKKEKKKPLVKKNPKTSKKQPSSKETILNKKRKNEFYGNVIVFGCFTICLIILLTKVIMITSVMSGSMEPTLKTGDYVVYNRLAYITKNISRGDIVCFYSEENEEVYAKRVIGIEGDTISFADGYLLINGEKVEESYIGEDVETNSAEEFIVPEGKIFLLGDNRGNSYDSRFWENPFVSKESVYGKYIGKIKSIF